MWASYTKKNSIRQHRLTFWLSNSVVLRAILSQAFDNQTLSLSGAHSCEATTSNKGKKEKLSALRWRDSYSSLSKETRGALHQNVEKWEDFNTFTSALQSIETWIFSRIVESIWWQVANLSTFYLNNFPLLPWKRSSCNTFLNLGSIVFSALKSYVRGNILLCIDELIWFHDISFSRFWLHVCSPLLQMTWIRSRTHVIREHLP